MFENPLESRTQRRENKLGLASAMLCLLALIGASLQFDRNDSPSAIQGPSLLRDIISSDSIYRDSSQSPTPTTAVLALVPTVPRGNAVFDALRRLSGRRASGTAFPRRAWERVIDSVFRESGLNSSPATFPPPSGLERDQRVLQVFCGTLIDRSRSGWPILLDRQAPDTRKEVGMFTASQPPTPLRRGVTLVEMLVVVALLVLMMVILVQVFQSALGAMSTSRTTQELDVVLRSLDSMIRSDLSGVTAKMTPPNDPALKQGYFEYGENAPADLQGEDTDDYLAFTTKAREGQFFTGRQWLGLPANQKIQPITITSQTAEVIYFVRNGNLYRRVFLVAPDRARSLTQNGPGLPAGVYKTSMFGNSRFVSWQGMNDISCRPGGFLAAVNPLAPGAGGAVGPVPLDLGDLTNRENRAFRPRFMNDFSPLDGIPDDNNADGVPDYYPTLYYDGVGNAQKNNNGTIGWAPNSQVHEGIPYVTSRASVNPYDVYAFPFIYPGMYSVPDPGRMTNGLGSMHYLPPNTASGYINHSPLDTGESLVPGDFTPGGSQTFWGFPTWRETMSGLSSGGGTGWRDPINFVSRNGTTNPTQPEGLRPIPPGMKPSTYDLANLLPPVCKPGTNSTPAFFDGVGSSSFVAAPLSKGSKLSLNPNPIWEDDLILTNVRSFDVKAYDQAAPLYNTAANGFFSAGYQDLGYGSASFVGGPNGIGASKQLDQPFQTTGADPVGFGHEGRIPPLWSDFRPHPRRGYNIGDNSPGVIRLTHTFDTWSTDYVNAPDSDIILNGYSGASLPIYPSFPPPYPSPLRGIQIQIRVVDPRNERTKVLTIRHDFTDKLTN